MGDRVQAYCEFRECSEPAERVQDDGLALCASHRKQFQRRGRLTEIQARISPEEAVLRAGGEWIDADSDDDEAYDHARARFLTMAERWMRARGWSPPQRACRSTCRVLVVQLSLPLQVTGTATVHTQGYARRQAAR